MRPSIHLSIHLTNRLAFYRPFDLSIWRCIDLFSYRSIRLFARLAVALPTYRSIYLSPHVPINLSIDRYSSVLINQSINLFICLSSDTWLTCSGDMEALLQRPSSESVWSRV